MALLFLIGLVLVAVAAALVARALALPRMQMSAHLREIETYGFNADRDERAVQQDASARRSRAWLDGLAERIGRSVGGGGWRAPVEGRSLRAAGSTRTRPKPSPASPSCRAFPCPASFSLSPCLLAFLTP